MRRCRLPSAENTYGQCHRRYLDAPRTRRSAQRRRLFRGVPVLDWTLRRLTAATSVGSATIFCWDDQLESVNITARNRHAGVICKGPRQNLPAMEAISASRRWADGWRSGLLGTCEFDLGFHATWVQELILLHDAEAALLVDPAAGLLDPILVESMLQYAATQPDAELYFMQAAPGLAATLLRRELVARLAIADVYPGRLLTYFPDHQGVDPIGKPGCAPVPTPVARSTYRFKLDSDRQIARADLATAHLNGHLISTEAEGLTHNMRGSEQADVLPREVVLEITTSRRSNPATWPGRYHLIDRPDLTLQNAELLFNQLGLLDDIRLTLGGVGDPLVSPIFFDIIAAARSLGISTICVETDLLTTSSEDLVRLARSGVDVISIQFPAAHSPTYAAIMGIDGFSRALQNVNTLEEEIKRAGNGIPLISMVFTKIEANLGEMELWYDYWMRRFGHAVLIGPSDYSKLIPDFAVADMSPQNRKPCVRLSSRMTVLSDGKVVACEQDVLGTHPMGMLGETSISDMWRQSFANLRRCHLKGDYTSNPTCGNCREWHRA